MSLWHGYRSRRSQSSESPLETAETAFALLVRGPNPLAVDGAGLSGLPDALVPLDRLRELLLDQRACPLATVDAVWAELVGRSRTDGPRWTVGCVGVALPGLAGQARKLTAGFADDPTDIHAEVLAGFLAELATVDVGLPWIEPRLRMAAFRAGYAARRHALQGDVPVDDDGFRSRVPQPPWGHPDLVLARAVAENVLTPAEADLISATRLGDVDLHAYAAQHGWDYKACQSARLRAEYRLVDFLLDPTDGAGPPCEDDDGLTDRAATTVPITTAARRPHRRRTRPRSVTATAKARSQQLRRSLPPRPRNAGS